MGISTGEHGHARYELCKPSVERSECDNQLATASEANSELSTATSSLRHISISRQRAHVTSRVLRAACAKDCMWILKPQNIQNTQKGLHVEI